MATKKVIELQIKGKGVKLTADQFKKLSKEVDRVGRSAKKTGNDVNFMRVKTAGLRRQLGALRNVLLIVTFVFAGFIRALNKAVEAYKRQFQAEQQLIAGLKNVAGNVKGAADELIRYAGALQKVTTFSDENTISGMAMLSTFQMNAAAIKEVTPRMLDMAAAAQIAGASEQELKSIAIALGKGLTGQVGMLTRYGVVLDKMGLATARAKGKTAEFNFVLKQLDQNFKGIAEQLATSTIGELIRLEHELSDMSERVGKLWAPVAVEFKKAQLAVVNFLATIVLMRKVVAENELGLFDFFKAFKMAREELLKFQVPDEFDLGGFRLPPDLAIELANLNKEFAHQLELLKLHAVMNDGIIDQKEQLIILELRENQVRELFNLGLLEEIDALTQLTKLWVQYNITINKLTRAQQAQVAVIQRLANAMTNAAFAGENMGDAIVASLKAIIVEITALIVVAAIAAMFGIPVGKLLGGSGGIGSGIVRALFSAPSGGTVGTSGLEPPPSPTTNNTTNVIFPNAILIGADEAAVRDTLIPLIDQARVNA